MKKQILKVGFDLDGVLLYNPARIIRPIMFFTKKYILKRDLNKFYYPKNKIEKLIWWFLHKSSLWPSSGIKEIIKLVKQKKINAYVVSARYELLEKDFTRWINIIDPDKVFSGYFYNNKNDQPQLFKDKMIKKLKLDIFVEDNWDIVKHLNSNIKNHPVNSRRKKSKIYWIYNILDKGIKYHYKFPTLISVIQEIKNKL
ncbi:MAG: hypothetical protein UR54_C0014G0004 [Candidatus Roizmanbacteria bacterium GW2011_GWA2_34_18]|uniref:Uncharacterized protein n=1 Tax=Candidatus Roizmanbacteria bacterium GW2011_GWA2_34_18 TaxID=1618477 RepID=A0A0G0B9D7_9BACT|nr:MAG: hypothetical protein UR54_C0014G0004 [Candidatus Roizmanbacteria bacterium GW2011_GWA2_34_18]